MQAPSTRFARISRVRKRYRQAACLHVRLSVPFSDEAQDVRGTPVLRGPKWNGERESERRNISNLLIGKDKANFKKNCKTDDEPVKYGKGG